MIYEGKYDQVMELVNNTSDQTVEVKLVDTILNHEMGKYDRATSTIQAILEREKEITDAEVKIRVNIEAAYIDWRMNKLQSASIRILNIQKQIKKSQLNPKDKDNFETWLSHIEAIIAWSSGNIDNAIELSRENYEKFLRMKNNKMASLSSNNLGVLYTEKGKFADGLIAFEKAFHLNNRKYVADFARSKNNLSNLYRDLGEYSDSIKQAEEALEIQNHLGNSYEISGTLLSLVLLYNQVKLSGKMVSYHSHLMNITSDINNNPIIQVRKELSNIIILKESFRLRDKYEALLKLKAIINRTDIRSDLLVVSLKFFCEMLFFDWKLTGNAELVMEIDEVLDQLQNISQYQKSILLESEVLFLKSQLYMLQNNFDHAKQLLKSALNITQTNGFHNMAMRVSNAFDHLLEKETEIKGSDDDKQSINQRDQTSLEDYFERYAISPHFKPKMDHEISVMFLIMKQEGGMLIYSHHFIEDEHINEHLLSSFISAVSSFASTTFKSGALERIKSGDFTLLINSSNNLLFVYIFRGYSYFGIPKLEYLATKLSELEVLNEMKTKYIMTNVERDTLQTEVMKVISAQYESV